VHVTAIIAAAGRGSRLGGSRPKQLLAVGGRELLERSVELFASHPAVNDVIVALPADLAVNPPAYLRRAPHVRIVAGGARRQDSVANAFAAVSEQSDVVVVHDAARPFASAALVTRTIEAAAETGAALAALPARDTVKRAAAGPPLVTETLPREQIYLAQTPQAFRRDVLQAALALAARSPLEATDEAALAERLGRPVRLVEGEAANIKVTTADDVPIAEALAGGRAVTARIGIGYDIHRLVEGRQLILGGVTIPFDRGLKGHSDGDTVCHAIIEAILGAAAAGDIGRHFPDTDPAWAGASSLDLLRRAVAVVRQRGLEVANVDASIIAERPKLAPHVDRMRANVAEAIGVGIEQVSIKGKTNEGVGELGRGEAIAAHATALLHAR
jgi:2-C-methyl-D-erythritol 4-phosphate cytidylyltransferase/2-C-methyl-D-erythritol 2,4-cyclodiphosphate synthase